MSTPDAGPELDLQVMSSVFGRRILTYEEMRDEAVRVWDTQPRCVHFNSLGGFNGARIAGGVVCAQFAPRYSTDIAAAWTILEPLERGSPRRYAEVTRRGYHTREGVVDGWSCQFRDIDEPWNWAYVEAQTAPLAICLAALKAVSSPPPVMET